ncbi:MAG: DUF5325 family protein [Bacillaceae bacterium]
MKGFQFQFFIIALLGVVFMMLIGIMVAEKNIIGIIIALILLILTIGYGFIQKKKHRTN